MRKSVDELESPRPGFGCPYCARTTPTEQGLKVHITVVHERPPRRRKARKQVRRYSPPIRIYSAIGSERQYIAHYTCGHMTRLHPSWNPVVTDPDVGPYEGFCRVCQDILPIREFDEIDVPPGLYTEAARRLTPESYEPTRNVSSGRSGVVCRPTEGKPQ